MHRLSEPIAPIRQVAVKPLKRIAQKGRKYGESQDKSWEDVLRENIEDEGWVYEVSGELEEPRNLPGRAVSEKKPPASEPAVPGKGGRNYDEMIAEIHKMADSPEQLVDSHMGIMTEPVESGKWVNAAG